ncbi:MAG: EAL domain-containing protein [Actinomycetota bacterium]|nr:EAL domain-containing protein [Actinomycetota bacterium]
MAAALVLAGGLIATHLLAPDGLIRDWTYLAALVGAAIAALVGALHRPFSITGPLIAIGVAISALGDVTWQWIEWNSGAPNVSVADIFWLGSYIALVGALLRAPRATERVDYDGVVDVVVVFIVAMLVQWELAFKDIVTDVTVPAADRLVWALYPTFDAVLLALVIRAGLSRRLHGWNAVLLGGGISCWLLSDFGYTIFATEGTLEVWLNVGWMVGSILLAFATWHQRSASGRRATQRITDEGTKHSGIAIALLPLLVPGAIAVLGHVRDEPTNPFLLYGVTVMLVALAFARGTRILKAEGTARAAVRSQERYARAVAVNSSDALILLDEHGVIVNDSPQLAALLGYPEAPTAGADVFTLVAPDDQEEARAVFERCWTSSGQTFETELRAQHRAGHLVWLGARIVNLTDDPDVGGAVVNLHDITDRKWAEAELSHLAFHDGLTDLANRALFSDRVEHALRRSTRGWLSVAVIFLDLDGFKTVNDSLGHGVGDQLLREVASRLSHAVRAGDTVARLGGDEFAILIEQSTNAVEESIGVAERILQLLADPIALDDQSVTVSASIGIAAGDAESTATSLLRDADVAMYRAKTAGKARWVTYDPEMRAAAVERLQLENDLIRALDEGQLALVYQPVILLETEEIVGFEALLRWNHPTVGLIAPDRFIPIAEETGLIIPIGKWVLDEACSTLARWHRDHPQHHSLSMAVNVSARQIASPTLVAAVRSALADSGIEPSSLVLEMTETTLIHDARAASERLKELSALGVRLAIDDFGTGYSSLSYLRQFPVDILKIDRSFISMISDRTQVPAIVRGLLDLAHTLELETVAEGVELTAQRDQLRSENCDLAQGFLFSSPLNPEEAQQLLMQLTPRAVGVELDVGSPAD